MKQLKVLIRTTIESGGEKRAANFDKSKEY